MVERTVDYQELSKDAHLVDKKVEMMAEKLGYAMEMMMAGKMALAMDHMMAVELDLVMVGSLENGMGYHLEKPMGKQRDLPRAALWAESKGSKLVVV